MKNNNDNSKLNNESGLDDLDFSVIGEVRGEDAYNMIASMSSDGFALNNIIFSNHAVREAGIFSEAQKENMLKILNDFKKHSNIKYEYD